MSAAPYSGLHFWIILGKNNTRKGSTIRALTGIDRSKDCDVALQSGQSIRFWAQIRSVNEANEESPEVFSKGSLNEVGPSATNICTRRNLLIALRLDFGKVGFEPEDYVRELVRQGAFIEATVTLGEPTREWVKDLGAPYSDVRDIDIATNAICAEVREHWGWK